MSAEEGPTSTQDGKTARRLMGRCPYDATPLAPLADTPNWFRCRAAGWKHYFYRNEGREFVDVDTNQPVPKKAPPR